MRNATVLISLLLSLGACNQASEQNEQIKATQSQSVTEQNNSSIKTNDEERYPLFFVEAAKNLGISTHEFAQAMQRAGDNNASMESVAKELGVSIDALKAALPKRPPRKITFEPATNVEIQETVESESEVKVSE